MLCIKYPKQFFSIYRVNTPKELNGFDSKFSCINNTYKGCMDNKGYLALFQDRSAVIQKIGMIFGKAR